MASQYKSGRVHHSSDLTASAEQANVDKITTDLVVKYKFSKFMTPTTLLFVFLGFFSCIAAYFFKNGEDITLLAGVLFFGGFAAVLANIFLLVFFNQKRMDLQPFAYLIYQIKAVDYACVDEFVLPGTYSAAYLKKAIEKIIETGNVKGYCIVDNLFVTNNKSVIPYDYKPAKKLKEGNGHELPVLDVLNKNIYRFKKLNIFIANHLVMIVVCVSIVFFAYIVSAAIMFRINAVNPNDAILAMKILFIPFFSFAFVLAFGYNIFIANASFKLDYYDLIELVLSLDEISISRLAINNIKRVPLLKYILKQLIKTKVLKNYCIKEDVICKKTRVK